MELNNISSAEDVKQALREWMTMNNFSQADVGRRIGKSGSLISQFLAGKYQGNTTELTHDIIGLMAREFNRKLEEIEIPTCMTENTIDVMSVCSLVHQTRAMGVIHGGSGYGKTTGLKLYMKKHNQSIMVTCVRRIKGLVLSLILDELKPKKIRRYRTQAAEVIAIIEELKGTDLLLIIDEAHHLEYDQFEQIRAIHDATGTPVIYAGNDDIVDRMTGKHQFDFDQIYSRVPIKKNLNGKIARNDVELILQGLGLKPDRDIVRFLEKKVNEQGHFRVLKNLLSNAIRFARKDNIAMNIEHLSTAEQLLLGKRYSAMANAN